MDAATRIQLDNIRSQDRDLQNAAYAYLMVATEQPVDWAYEAWDELLESLHDEDNKVRAIASQVLSNLARSDPESRMLKDFDALLAVTKDERFVTARHCMQSLWKIGVVGEAQQARVLDGLAARYTECADEKNCTLIRYDIIENFRKLYDLTHDQTIRERALALIATEPDAKYRKKYGTLWRGA
ncbi:MAG: hypothetical protein IT320_16060 [Anaerolineae bacterium]|nr:hypothetical protein [Anaerolineae bacterium]